MIAFAYQFGSLILPAVVPAVAWVLTHRAFLERLRALARAPLTLVNRYGIPLRESFVQHIIVVVVVAVAYVALAFVSKAVAVLARATRGRCGSRAAWCSACLLASRALALARACWPAASSARPASRSTSAVGSSKRIGYGAIEVIDRGRRGAHRVAAVPAAAARSTSARELAALIFGGRAAAGADGRAARDGVARRRGRRRFGSDVSRVGRSPTSSGTLLVAPVIIAWARFRLRRSGGMTDARVRRRRASRARCSSARCSSCSTPNVETRFGGSVGESLTYVPIVFMALVGAAVGHARRDARGVPRAR